MYCHVTPSNVVLILGNDGKGMIMKEHFNIESFFFLKLLVMILYF